MTRRAPKEPEVSQILPKSLMGPYRMEVKTTCRGLPGLACIYRVSCHPAGRHYIGQTTDLARRWLEHQEQLWARGHPNAGLQGLFNTYGPLAMSISVLRLLPGRYDERAYARAEQQCMDQHGWDTLCNVRPAGTDNWLRTTKEGRLAGQAAQRRRASQGKHKRNKHHF